MPYFALPLLLTQELQMVQETGPVYFKQKRFVVIIGGVSTEQNSQQLPEVLCVWCLFFFLSFCICTC